MNNQPIICHHNNTVLYPCAKTHYLTHFITVRMTMYRDKRAVLLVSERYEKDEVFKNLQASGVFDEVATIDFFPGGSLMLHNKEITGAELKDCIAKHFDAELYRMGYGIHDFFNIILCNDRIDYEFEIYLAIKKAPFFLFETKAGAYISRAKGLDSIFDPHFATLMVETQTFTGRCPYATVFYNHAGDDFSPTLGRYRLRYHLNEEIKRIKQEDRTRILKGYSYAWTPPPTRPKGSNCLFSLQGTFFMNDPIKKAKKYCDTYMQTNPGRRISLSQFVTQYVIDYFTDTDDAIFVKTHPNDPITEIEVAENFNSAITMMSKLPAQFYELEPAIRDYTFDVFVEFGSLTSSMTIPFKRGYPLGKDFPACIPFINPLWFTLGLLNEALCLDEVIGCYGVSAKHVKVLASKRLNREIECCDIKMLNKNDVKKVTIIDKIFHMINIDKLNNVETLVFLTANDPPSINGYTTMRFVIQKESLKDKRRANLQAETFYILTKNNNVRKRIEDYCEIKDLNMVGIRLICDAVK